MIIITARSFVTKTLIFVDTIIKSDEEVEVPHKSLIWVYKQSVIGKITYELLLPKPHIAKQFHVKFNIVTANREHFDTYCAMEVSIGTHCLQMKSFSLKDFSCFEGLLDCDIILLQNTNFTCEQEYVHVGEFNCWVKMRNHNE